MRRRRLGATEFEITPIGLGCMQFAGPGLVEGFYPAIGQETVTAIVGAALAGGVNWFDTAEMYGKGASERALTTGLRAHGVKPGEVMIATKWTPTLRTAASIGHTVGDRLAALQGFPIDLHQIHQPVGSLSGIPRQVEAMARLCREGRITAVGVSNFSARQMRTAAVVLAAHGLTLASNQVQISLLHRDVERDGTLRTARELGVTLIAYSPLRSGLLTGKFHENPELVRKLPRVRRLMGGFSPAGLKRTAPLVAELNAIGKAYGVSAGQVALAWLTGFYGDTVVAIPGASKPRHVEESAAVLDLELTERELDRLAGLSPARS
ncbi:aryl-alcohol dehydrogenase-like predicted oxidoreductase [Thermocatellispora tengchongensis]|uniref:Aryl-alcohol dehydrogenase-like predicted oxidoreductase n=1 Tax=Thermocatellispora tengchongensis TaxID=1073253 RepID=A0A840P1N3_9ACTN|nr:aldo/keto reductase [Thermocatellispora tengchongensis]MBB5132376.1 aryl-alcohol dehydrogenase-like predicted oxidoreductase [Thermocatellispora tengchongensis]